MRTVGVLQIEKAGVHGQLQTARDKIQSLEAELYERSNHMLAALNQLQDRLAPTPLDEVAPLSRQRRGKPRQR